MAELALVDYFVMGEAIGIVATLFVSFYFSRKQMQKLSIDIETKVLSDLDEKIHDLTRIAVEKPQLIRIVSNVDLIIFFFKSKHCKFEKDIFDLVFT